jgi:hypothetical protein
MQQVARLCQLRPEKAAGWISAHRDGLLRLAGELREILHRHGYKTTWSGVTPWRPHDDRL